MYHKTFEATKLPYISMKMSDTETIKYTNLSDLIETITTDIKNFKPHWYDFYFPREFNHARTNKEVKLKFTKNDTTGKCTFIINDLSKKYPPYYLGVQVIYEPEYARYRISMPKYQIPIEIPCILLFIGFKVLFSIHGYEYVKSFKDMEMHLEQSHDDIFPEWFQRLVVYPNYDGTLYRSLVQNVIQA